MIFPKWIKIFYTAEHLNRRLFKYYTLSYLVRHNGHFLKPNTEHATVSNNSIH